MFESKEIKNRNYYYNDLYYDFIFDFKKIKHNYFYDYTNISDFNNRARDILSAYDDKLRPGVSKILKKINLDYKCGIKTVENIESLEKSGAMVVVGGQQPGLLGGPLFIIYKIISIIKLSIFLTEYLKQKVIPVFWNASDDSNFSQVNSAYFFNTEGNIFKAAVSEKDASVSSGGKRYSDITVGRDVLEQLAADVSSAIQNTEYTSWINGLMLDSMPAASQKIRLTDFFSNIITRLFKEYGLVIFDPDHPGLKEIALETAFFDIERHDDIEKAITEKGRCLENEGYHSQLKVEKNAMNFYIVSGGRRNRVRCQQDGTFIYGKNRASKKELITVLKENPRCMSLNVVLRPVFQDYVMPVLATVCGPGEVSYFAQLKGAYEVFSKKTAVIYPRLSATIIEKKVEKSLSRLNGDFEGLAPDKQAMLESASGRIMQYDIDGGLSAFENGVICAIDALKKTIRESGMDVESSFGRIENNIKKEISVLRKKIISGFTGKKTSIAADVNKVMENVFPSGALQERYYNVFNYINKYGPAFIEEIIDLTDVRDYLHRFIFPGRHKNI